MYHYAKVLLTSFLVLFCVQKRVMPHLIDFRHLIYFIGAQLLGS